MVAPRAGLPGAARDAPRQVSAGGFQTSAACAAPAALPVLPALRSVAPLPLGSPGAREARAVVPPGGQERREGAAAVRDGTRAGASRVHFPCRSRGTLCRRGAVVDLQVLEFGPRCEYTRSPAGFCPNSCGMPAGGRAATRTCVCLAPVAAGRWRGLWFPAGFQEKTSGVQ